ncbi:MAG: hypothetical protein MZV63_16170 [Marinilabiliales bacterium]|nr:hypothetical protein [Marinilabiliales bacterium]
MGWNRRRPYFCYVNLPITNRPGEHGRADKYAAEAVKAHVHVSKEFSKAKTLLDDIMLNGGFELADKLYDSDDMTHGGIMLKRSIFEIQSIHNIHNDFSAWDIRLCLAHQEGSFKLRRMGIFSAITMSVRSIPVSPDGLPVIEIENREPLQMIWVWEVTERLFLLLIFSIRVLTGQ